MREESGAERHRSPSLQDRSGVIRNGPIALMKGTFPEKEDEIDQADSMDGIEGGN